MPFNIMLEDIEQLDAPLIQALIKKHKSEELPRLLKLKKYYLAKHDILQRKMQDPAKPNNKIANPYGSYITDMVQGYFLGKPIAYTSEDSASLEKIQDVYDANDEEAHNSLIGKDMSIYGVAYELLYNDEESKPRMTMLPVEETFMIYNTSIDPKPIGAVRYYEVMNYLTKKGDLRVEVYTESFIKYYKQDKKALQFASETINRFKGVTINPYFNNDEEMGDFEKVMSQIDAYDKSVSDQVNDMEYMADAFLHIAGVDAENADFADMKNNRIMVTGPDGKVSWVVKQTDNATVESYKGRLQQDIHKFSQVPDLTSDEFSGGQITGIALAYRFQGLEQICANKERQFKKSLANRVKLIANFLNIKASGIDPNVIKPVFTRNVPVNLLEYVQMVKDLYGTMSLETLLAQVPFIANVQEELDRIQAEKNNGSLDNYEFNPVTPKETNEIKDEIV